jgi:hypothetical protein
VGAAESDTDADAVVASDDAVDTGVVADRDGGRRERTLVWLALALTVAPLAVSAIHLIFFVADDYVGFGDVATSEMYIRDIGDHVLLLGPYSRDGWFHPGPLFFYLLAVPYRLLGSASINLPLGALLVNGASVVAMALLARRRGGLPLLLCTLVACALLMNGLGPEFLSMPWNPYLVVLPYGVLLFLVWALLCGEAWALPVAAFVASYLAQTHIAYVVLAVPLFLAGAAGLVLSRRRSPAAGTRLGQVGEVHGDQDRQPAGAVGERADAAGDVLAGRAAGAADDRADAADDVLAGQAARRRSLLGASLATAVVLAVVWLPPLVEQLIHDPGNLGEATEYFFFREGESTRTLGDGWRVVTAQYGPSPEWLTGRAGLTEVAEPRYVYSAVLPVLLVLVVAAAVLLWRRARIEGRTLVVVWLCASLVGVVATARTIGPIFYYRLGWAWVLGMVGGLLVLWAGWQLAVERWGGVARRVLAAAAMVALAGLAVVNSVATRGAEALDQDGSWALSELGPAVRDTLPEGEDQVVVNASSFGALSYSAGLRLDLERHGIDARAPLADDRQGRTRRWDEGAPARALLLVAVDAEVVVELWTGQLELVAYAGRLPQRELLEQAERVEGPGGRDDLSQLTATERAALLDRLSDVIPVESAVAVFAVPTIGN